MLLAVDVGNTSCKYGLFRDQALIARWRIETVRDFVGVELARTLQGSLEEQGLAERAVDAVVIASVVPRVTPAWCEALRASFGCEPLVVGPGIETGVTLQGPSPIELGADRLVNAVAAWSLARSEQLPGRAVLGSIVVDLGTATKLDCVSPQGEFLGGVIAPGVSVGLDALVARAARLRAVELHAPARVLGHSTTECVQSGLLHGHASLVDGLVSRLRRELGFDCQVIGTGGFASLIAPLSETLRRIEPDLTLHGLRAIHERNPR